VRCGLHHTRSPTGVLVSRGRLALGKAASCGAASSMRALAAAAWAHAHVPLRPCSSRRRAPTCASDRGGQLGGESVGNTAWLWNGGAPTSSAEIKKKCCCSEGGGSREVGTLPGVR